MQSWHRSWMQLNRQRLPPLRNFTAFYPSPMETLDNRILATGIRELRILVTEVFCRSIQPWPITDFTAFDYQSKRVGRMLFVISLWQLCHIRIFLHRATHDVGHILAWPEFSLMIIIRRPIYLELAFQQPCIDNRTSLPKNSQVYIMRQGLTRPM